MGSSPSRMGTPCLDGDLHRFRTSLPGWEEPPKAGDPPEFGNLPLGWGHPPGWGMAPQDWGKPSLVGDTLFPQGGVLPEAEDSFRLGTPLPAWRTPPKWGFPRMGTPNSAWGLPPVREHPQDDTPTSMGLPLKMETPLEWGHPSRHGDHPSKMGTSSRMGTPLPCVFPLFDTGVASTQGGIRLGGWEGPELGGVPCAGREH